MAKWSFMTTAIKIEIAISGLMYSVLDLYLLAFEVQDRRLKLLHSFISSQKRTRVVPGALTWVLSFECQDRTGNIVWCVF